MWETNAPEDPFWGRGGRKGKGEVRISWAGRFPFAFEPPFRVQEFSNPHAYGRFLADCHGLQQVLNFELQPPVVPFSFF